MKNFLLEPFHRAVRKRQTQAPKFYLFDPGVKRALTRTLTVEPSVRLNLLHAEPLIELNGT